MAWQKCQTVHTHLYEARLAIDKGEPVGAARKEWKAAVRHAKELAETTAHFAEMLNEAEGCPRCGVVHIPGCSICQPEAGQ